MYEEILSYMKLLIKCEKAGDLEYLGDQKDEILPFPKFEGWRSRPAYRYEESEEEED